MTHLRTDYPEYERRLARRHDGPNGLGVAIVISAALWLVVLLVILIVRVVTL